MTSLSHFAAASRSDILAVLERAGCNPRPTGPNRWTALCPVHERDGEHHKPSLSVAIGADGRVLLHCFAGCPTASILKKLGLEWSDFWPTDAKRKPEKPAGAKRKPGKPAGHSQKTGRVFPTDTGALDALRAKWGPESNVWRYHNRDRLVVGLTVRWDLPNGQKIILPVSRHAKGWRHAAMPAPRPLYRIPEILTAAPAQPVFVAEGEKCADALVRCGLLGTTSAGGANAAKKTDWSPLAGRRVIILPDNDDAGERYATDVARCCRAAGASDVRILRLAEHAPELPGGGDIADVWESPTWCGIGLGDAATPEELGNLLCRLADAAPQWVSEGAALHWEPFPVEALPAPMRDLVLAGARALQCDPALVALPALAIAAGCIGLTRVLRLKNTWRVPAILWCATVAESGSLKTPAFRLAERALRLREQKARDDYLKAVDAYDDARTEWDRAYAQWRRSKTDDPAPEKPRKPIARRVTVTDITVERLASLLAENPRGLLLARDELSGWLASFDRYASHGYASADVAFWLSAHCAEPVQVDRKTNNEHIYVPRAAVSVCGTIQPRTLARSLGLEHRENGLLARLLLAMPPRKPKAWTDADVAPGILGSFGGMIDKLLGLEPIIGDDNMPKPVELTLTADAREVWIAYYNRHAQEHSGLEGDLAAAWGKLEEYAARLALVVHLVRWAGTDSTTDPQTVDAQSMTAGVTLAEWFKRETMRVYAAMEESAEERQNRQLVEWIAGRGGQVTVREVTRGLWRFRAAAESAEAALNELVTAGLGHWESVPQHQEGGRPMRMFRLLPTSTSTKPL